MRKIFILSLSLFIAIAAEAKNLNKKVDVLVVCGGAGGTAAGIQSARSGAKTLIVEPSSWLGGMLTAAGVSCTDGNHDLPSGIWAEFRQKLYDRYGGPQAVATGWVSYTQFEPHVGDSIFKAMTATEKNLQVLYGYHFKKCILSGHLVQGAIFENGKNTLTIHAKIVIDGTELGDVMKASGTAYSLGMDSRKETGESMAPEQRSPIIQDITYAAILKDYGPHADMTIKKPDSYNPKLFKGCCSLSTVKDSIDRIKMLNYGRLPHGKYMINWPEYGNDIYLNVVEKSEAERTKELKKAKEHTLSFIYYIQHELGLKNLGLADDEFPTADKLPFIPYHREGRRLQGVVLLTINHILKPYDMPEKLYRTGISVGDYPIDHHHGQNPHAPHIDFPPVPSFCVPMGAIVPKVTNGLLVTEKGISSTNIVNGATRLQPCVLLTGQAAGALAALSVKSNTQPRNISVRKLQNELLNQNAYLLPLFDIKPANPYFKAAQKIAATGILKTKGIPYSWANQTWFYPDTTISASELTKGLNEYDKHFVREEGQSTPLSVKDACSILESFIQNCKVSDSILSVNGIKSSNEGEIIRWAENHWHEISSVSFNAERNIRKIEVAVLLDKLIDPFNQKDVDLTGNFK